MSRMQKMTYDFVFGAADTVITKFADQNGYITDILIKNPANTNSVTAALSIQDNEAYELYNSGAKNASTTTHIPSDMAAEVADIPCDIKSKLVLTLSGVPGGAGTTVRVNLYFKATKY